MKLTPRIARFLAPLFLAPLALLAGGCGGGSSSAVVNGDLVTVSGGQIEFQLTRRDDFQDTFVLFGGAELNHENAINQISISGLDKDTAQELVDEHGDIYSCSSRGSRYAMNSTQQLDLIPASSRIHDQLADALAQFKDSLGSGERTCLRLRGSVLELTKAIEPKTGMDILAELPHQLRQDYYLIEYVEVVGDQAVLAGF